MKNLANPARSIIKLIDFCCFYNVKAKRLSCATITKSTAPRRAEDESGAHLLYFLLAAVRVEKRQRERRCGRAGR